MGSQDSTLAAVSIGLGILLWDYVFLFRREIKLLSTFSQHPIQSFCFTTLRCLCLFSLAASIAFILSKGSICRAFLICTEISTIVIYVIHSVVFFSFPTSFRSDRKWRIVALSCSIALFTVMVVCFIISATQTLSHNVQDSLQCQLLRTGRWKLIGMSALMLFGITVLFHYLQMGYRERAMTPYFFDILCMGLITLIMIVVLVLSTLNVLSNKVDFTLRVYVLLIVTMIDTRLLLKRVRETEHVDNIPLPAATTLSSILDDVGLDDHLTTETASLSSHHDTQSSTLRNKARARLSTPFAGYDGYSHYTQAHLEDVKASELPLVNREVVITFS